MSEDDNNMDSGPLQSEHRETRAFEFLHELEVYIGDTEMILNVEGPIYDYNKYAFKAIQQEQLHNNRFAADSFWQKSNEAFEQLENSTMVEITITVMLVHEYELEAVDNRVKSLLGKYRGVSASGESIKDSVRQGIVKATLIFE